VSEHELCLVSGCDTIATHHCSVCDKPLCDDHAEADSVPERWVDYCPLHWEAWKKSLQDGKVGEAGAVFAVLGWLTSREEVSGPFSAKHEASQAAELAGKFCKMQGWEITDERWHRHIKPYSEVVPDSAITSEQIANEVAEQMVSEHKGKPDGMIAVEPTSRVGSYVIRTIVREELATFKSDIVKQVIHDLNHAVRLQGVRKP
jgi:hypothetical protein